MMGTLVSFTIVHADKDIAMTAIRKAAQEMQRIEDTFTIYGDKANSIKDFNQFPIHSSFTFTPEVNTLIEIALNIEQQSHGAFSPTLAALNKLWGFSNPEPPNTPPSLASIQKLLPGTRNCLQPQAKQWSRTTPTCQLDFGGIAKGYAMDRGIEVLKKYGIQNAMINAGGD
ncbi:MAG: FAD:protein FMN transferase, partial [Mariprofundaceae bacterium]|nr:FAD:protein FMN transferase [Mariprofundaceae bacterium]